MRIGLVARCLNTAHVRGMGRYVHELLAQGAEDTGLHWTLFGNDPGQPMRSPRAPGITSDVFEFRGDRFELWEQVGLPRRARAHSVDVLHCTEGSLPWWQPVPTVVTVHDTLAWQEMAPTPWNRLYWNKLLPAALHRCKAVITISESSRRDIVAKWPTLAARTHVIPHGIGDEYLDSNTPGSAGALQQGLKERRYLVYVGGPLSRKRFDWAVQVLQACGHEDLQLVACGFAESTHGQARDRVPEALRTRVHFAPYLSNQELLALYRGAAAVLYPTLYEGFGFPAIEAQAAGAPAIFSPISSLEELQGPLTLPVAPNDLSQWCAAIGQALAMGSDRSRRAAQALAWARRFSWRRSFEAHIQVYEQAASSSTATQGSA